MASNVNGNVDYRLVNSLSNLVICSQCLQNGTVTPVPQVISFARRITNLCAHCRVGQVPDKLRVPGKLIPFRPKRPM